MHAINPRNPRIVLATLAAALLALLAAVVIHAGASSLTASNITAASGSTASLTSLNAQPTSSALPGQARAADPATLPATLGVTAPMAARPMRGLFTLPFATHRIVLPWKPLQAAR